MDLRSIGHLGRTDDEMTASKGEEGIRAGAICSGAGAGEILGVVSGAE